MNNPRVAIELYVDDNGSLKIKQFAAESEASFKQVSSSAGMVSEGFGRMGSVLARVMGTYFSAQAAKNVIQMADNYTLLESRLSLVTKSSAELTKVEDDLFQSSQKTGTSYTANAELYFKLGMALQSVHASSAELLTINDLVNKSLIVSGAGAAESSSFILQFGQAMGSGVLHGDEFRAMMESNSYFGAQLARVLGTDIAGLRKMSEEGKLTTDLLRSAFPKMASEVNTAFDKMPVTIDRAMTMVENSFGKVINEANKTQDGTSGVAQAIKGLAQTIEQNKESLGSLFTGLIDGATGLTQVISNIGRSMAGWKAVNEGNLSFWDYANMNAKEMNEWLKKNNAEGKNQSFAQLNREAQAQIDFQRQINKEIKDRANGVGVLTEAQKRHNAEVEKELASHIKLNDAQTKEAEKLVAAEKKKADDIAKAQEEMYKETGMMADQHYAEELQKLTEKAARWKEAGGEIVSIENWLYDQIGILEEEADNKGETTAAAAMDRAQGNYRVLIDQLAAATQSTTDQAGLIQQKIQGLNGETFTIHANLDGSGFENTANALIEKIRTLAAVASSAQTGSSGKADPAWDGGMYDSYDVASGGTPAAGGKSSLGGSTTININQKVSRSDVTAIIAEQRRIEGRK